MKKLPFIILIFTICILLFASAKRQTFAIASVFLFSICYFLFALCSSAQAPQSFNYQLIARDTSGVVLSNLSLGIKISILQDAAGGTVVYSERHTAITNNYGLVNLGIGTGIPVSGNFQTIDWRTHLFFVKLEIDPTGGTNYFTMGTSQLVSVPYALYAEKAGNVVDTSNTNELQALSISNDTLFLSNGGFVKLPAGTSADWTRDGNNLYNNNSGNVGIGTNAPAGKFIVKGDSAAPATEPVFEVIGRNGLPIMSVYEDSIHFWINETQAKATAQGGFAVSGRSSSKGATGDYFVITPDSTRIYLNESADKANAQGGFAVSGRSSSKGNGEDYLSVNSDSVKVSKSLLIPRMTTYERDNLGFTPSEALIIFNMTDDCMQIYRNNVWSNIWCFNCAPDFIIQPVNDTICSGTNARFNVSLTGTNLVYRWQESTDGGNTWSDISNGGIYSGANSWTLTLANVPVSYHLYKYRCYVFAACPPAVTSIVATLHVGSTPPVIYAHPENLTLSTSCTGSFTISSPGYGLSYQWQVSSDSGINWSNISNGSIYSGVSTNAVSLSNVPLAYDSYYYRCIADNWCGTQVTSNHATLTVTPIEISAHPADLQLPNSHNAVFSVSASGPALVYQWQQSTDGGFGWNDLSNGGTNPVYSGADSDSLELTDVPFSFNTYKYRCIVSHFCRPAVSSNSATMTITIPTLSTIAATVSPVSAVSGGNITSDGGTTVTESGVCWSTFPNPTIDSLHTSDGSNMGIFTSNITGLALGVTYYARAYATNAIGTAYGNEISFTTVLAIGGNYLGGIVAYIFQPGDPGYIEEETHGLIAAPSDQSTGIIWYNGSSITTDASGTDIGTGNANTLAIIAAQGAGSYAASICAELELDGFNDWFLPSKDELNKLYLSKDVIGGFSEYDYWSSSEWSYNYVWMQNFGAGNQGINIKYGTLPVRAIRVF